MSSCETSHRPPSFMLHRTTENGGFSTTRKCFNHQEENWQICQPHELCERCCVPTNSVKDAVFWRPLVEEPQLCVCVCCQWRVIIMLCGHLPHLWMEIWMLFDDQLTVCELTRTFQSTQGHFPPSSLALTDNGRELCTQSGRRSCDTPMRNTQM